MLIKQYRASRFTLRLQYRLTQGRNLLNSPSSSVPGLGLYGSNGIGIAPLYPRSPCAFSRFAAILPTIFAIHRSFTIEPTTAFFIPSRVDCCTSRTNSLILSFVTALAVLMLASRRLFCRFLVKALKRLVGGTAPVKSDWTRL